MNTGFRVRLEFKPADFWIGVYTEIRYHKWVAADGQHGQRRRHVWICLLPTVPIHLSWGLE